MTLNAKIDALEHLVVALLEESRKRHGILPEWVFDRAHSSIMGSNGPQSAEYKAEAVKELDQLRALIR
ncbi:hypothetical protein [Pseudomonas monteilii]|uniref:hypothetical protein n=1 Tax=Pseudomonas monteilii TaxID=76759 RepID=UPI003D9664A7